VSLGFLRLGAKQSIRCGGPE